ncbi:hypothetical protein PINS_up018177 [Pythium insidiosum]|nr:hypothetical protein PINS_up018177 [Pythium insidiosum]
MEDGRILTLNKMHEIEALPDDLVRDKSISANHGASGSDPLEIDIEKLLAKQRERKEKLEASQDSANGDKGVEFVGGAAPTSVTEIANTTIRIKDDDGSWMTLRAANEIVKEMKSKPTVSAEAKSARRGITVKEYFDRVKKRRVDG